MTERTQINLRIDTDLLEQIDTEAVLRVMSRTALVEQLLRDALDRLHPAG